MEGLISCVILFIVMVLFFKVKSDWDDAHPEKCGICGVTSPSTIKLKDGCMCYKCANAKYRYKKIDLTSIMKKSDFKTYTVNEMKDYINTIRERGELMQSFQPTRVSASGSIQVDDNLHLFVIHNAGPISNTFAHDPADIESFKLVYDKDYINPSDSILIEGGHIEIKLKEPANKIGVYYLSKRDLIGAKHEVKKALEPDFKFLEEITGLKRQLL